VVLEKDGEDQLDRSCEKLTNIITSQEGKKHPVCNKMKEDRRERKTRKKT
jgi:hypothetical protein